MIKINSFALISTPLTLRLMKNNVDEDILNDDNENYDDVSVHDKEIFQSR